MIEGLGLMEEYFDQVEGDSFLESQTSIHPHLPHRVIEGVGLVEEDFDQVGGNSFLETLRLHSFVLQHLVGLDSHKTIDVLLVLVLALG